MVNSSLLCEGFGLITFHFAFFQKMAIFAIYFVIKNQK
jgi:hypothetical protein